jgi:hypothetical protein
VPDYCTCGAKLPEDARFCHKCGKPQRDEPVLVESEPVALPPPPAVAPAPEIGFHNRTAVWIALRVGVMAFLLSAVSGIFSVIWLVAGGYLCVYLYRRRTGRRLSIISGAHLGWLAGVFGFVISTVMITLFVALLSQPEFVDQVKQQLSRQLSESDVNQMIDLLRTPLGVGSVLLTFFFLFTLLPAFGGAVGAKFLDRGE